MQLIVIFKGKSLNGTYDWERVDDKLPKQLYTRTCPSFYTAFPKVNQQYIIYFSKRDGAELMGSLKLDNYVTTCNVFRVSGDDFEFKKTKNKGLLVSQYTSCFVNNPKERKWFIGYLTGLYNRTYNPHTRNNILRIFEEWINHCDIFGNDGGSVFLVGSYKGTDIKTVYDKQYNAVRRRLEYLENKVVNPTTKRNCQKWIEYLDVKFK